MHHGKKSILYNIDNKGTGEDKHRIISSICNLNDDPTILTKKDYISLKPYYESQPPTLKYTADNNFWSTIIHGKKLRRL